MKFSIDKPHMVYAEFIESGAIDQFKNVMAQPWVLRGALMPDAHRGYTLPIGGVVETDGVVSPVFVGMDIGCGVCAQPTSFNYDEVFDLRYRIRQALKIAIPLGFNHHKKSKTWHEYAKIPKTDWFNTLFNDRGGLKQIGTLGGGNHFIEIGADENKKVWIIIHSGSRGIGADTAKHYIRMAHPEGKVKDGAYGLDVNSQEGKDYIMDMNICLDFALENRVQMIERVMYIMGRFCAGSIDAWIINRTHNHAESKDGRYWIHRKGATHAEEGMLGVVPGNWRDGSFIVKGKGNPESLYSSSHGAGRILGRKAAKRTLDLGEQRSFIGDIAAEVDGSSIDEAPGAYKDIFEVMRQQTELVDIGAHVRPIINVKG